MGRPRIWAGVLTILLAASVRSQAAERPNIVVFLVDDLGFADCGYNGAADTRTPNIDALAGRGATFRNFYVQPLCSATRASLLTGRLPVHHGIYGALKAGGKGGLPVEERTLAQGLRAAGYATAIVGKWHLGEARPEFRPTRRGFDHQYGLWYGALDYFTHVRAGRVDWYRDDRPCADEGYTTRLIGREAERIVREQPGDKPLFLYVPFNAVHAPYMVPDADRAPFRALPPRRQTLAAMLAVVDEQVGRVGAALRERGMEGNTLVIFQSDNGGPRPGVVTRNDPLRAGKGTIYEGGIRTAAVAAWPGQITPGRAISEPCHVVDWYPTLLGIAGAQVDQPRPVDGRDLGPLLRGGPAPERDALLLVGTAPGRAAIRMGDWKLLVRATDLGAGEDDDDADDADDAPAPAARAGDAQLYDLAADPGERHDLAQAQPDRVRAMRARLDRLMRDAVRPVPNRP